MRRQRRQGKKRQRQGKKRQQKEKVAAGQEARQLLSLLRRAEKKAWRQGEVERAGGPGLLLPACSR